MYDTDLYWLPTDSEPSYLTCTVTIGTAKEFKSLYQVHLLGVGDGVGVEIAVGGTVWVQLVATII